MMLCLKGDVKACQSGKVSSLLIMISPKEARRTIIPLSDFFLAILGGMTMMIIINNN